jgi:hypothetical protein
VRQLRGDQEVAELRRRGFYASLSAEWASNNVRPLGRRCRRSGCTCPNSFDALRRHRNQKLARRAVAKPVVRQRTAFENCDQQRAKPVSRPRAILRRRTSASSSRIKSAGVGVMRRRASKSCSPSYFPGRANSCPRAALRIKLRGSSPADFSCPYVSTRPQATASVAGGKHAAKTRADRRRTRRLHQIHPSSRSSPMHARSSSSGRRDATARDKLRPYRSRPRPERPAGSAAST